MFQIGETEEVWLDRAGGECRERERAREQEERKVTRAEGHSRDQEAKEEQERDRNGPAPEQAGQTRAANQGIRKLLFNKQKHS